MVRREFIKDSDKFVRCPECKHQQELVINKNIWQDDSGKFTMCKKCSKLYHVEYEIQTTFESDTLYQLKIAHSDRSITEESIIAKTKDLAIKKAYEKFGPCLVINTEEIF